MKTLTSANDLSWGRLFDYDQNVVYPKNLEELRSQVKNAASENQPILTHGQGRSYGDSCLLKDGVLLDTKYLNKMINFDRNTGLLECEAGVTVCDIIQVFLNRGWFLPVSPGTKFVSLGGALANDVHGKNHHRSGTFGRFVESFKLLRSNGRIFECTPDKNANLFKATIGGLGLTGTVVSLRLRLKKVPSPYIDQIIIPFKNIEDYFDKIEEIDRDNEYTVAWLDCLEGNGSLGKGILIAGNHDENESFDEKGMADPFAKISIPIDAPSILLNKSSIKLFNYLYYHANAFNAGGRRKVFFDPFFYPLDKIGNWNRLYGKSGFFQFQFCMPKSEKQAFIEILKEIVDSKMGSFLAVLKVFGELQSPGLLSFPEPGYTLALDFSNAGEKTLNLLKSLADKVKDKGGRIYPAKDAIMSAEDFSTGYRSIEEFMKHKDPLYSSSFWERVTKGAS